MNQHRNFSERRGHRAGGDTVSSPRRTSLAAVCIAARSRTLRTASGSGPILETPKKKSHPTNCRVLLWAEKLGAGLWASLLDLPT